MKNYNDYNEYEESEELDGEGLPQNDAYLHYETVRYEEKDSYEDAFSAGYEEGLRQARRENRREKREEDDYYADEDRRARYYEPEPEAPRPEPRKPKKRRKKKKHFFRRFVVTVLVLAVLVFLFAGKAPSRAEEGEERIPGRCTVLVAGTDKEGFRTDTILLVSLDKSGGAVRLLSIPRDTYAPAYAVPKINSACGAVGGGERGMEELMKAVKTAIGFMPDAYALVDLDAFIRIVDLFGGVDFDVPMDMYYEDWDQDLLIDLRAGEQHLDGVQAMGLVRFRSGYATADIGRTGVQRDFIRAAAKQWIALKNIPKLPKLLDIVREEVLTDLSVRNYLWFARFLLKADLGSMQTDVLPGYADMVNGASVYMLDGGATAELMKDYSPYK